MTSRPKLQIDDPNLDSVLSSAAGRRLRRPIAELVIGATSGLTLVVLGVALSVVVLGVIGFPRARRRDCLRATHDRLPAGLRRR